MTRHRGQCSACGRSCRLRRDGTAGKHRNGGTACDGTGKAPEPFSPDNCPECVQYRLGTPGLLEACASVGIEAGKPALVLLRELLTAYHDGGHRELVP